MAPIALMMFVGLFVFGGQFFGWNDFNHHIQLVMFACFVFGLICGARAGR